MTKKLIFVCITFLLVSCDRIKDYGDCLSLIEEGKKSPRIGLCAGEGYISRYGDIYYLAAKPYPSETLLPITFNTLSIDQGSLIEDNFGNLVQFDAEFGSPSGDTLVINAIYNFKIKTETE